MFGAKISQKANQKQCSQELIYTIFEYDMDGMTQAITEGADIDTDDTLNINDQLMDPPVVAAIVADNLPALKVLLKRGAKVTAKGKCGNTALQLAITKGNFHLVEEMFAYNANPNTYYGSPALQAAIINLPNLAIIRYSDWSTPDIQVKLLDWYHQRGEFTPFESDFSQGVPFPEQATPLRASYKGMLEIISLMLSKGAQPWVANDMNLTVIDILADPLKYMCYFTGDKTTTGGRTTFLESTTKDILTFEVKLYNRNISSQPLSIIVDYDLREVKNRISKYMESHAKHSGVDIKELSEGFHSKVADHVDAYARTAAEIATRVQIVESNTLSVVEKNKVKQQWKARKEKLDAHPLTKLLCERVDSRLRSCIAATISLASDTGAHKIQRQKGTAEGILSETISLIGDQLGPFGGIVFKLVGKAVEFGIDKHYDDVYKRIADLFTFTDTENVCDKIAIATAEMYAALNTYPVATTSNVEKLADKTVAFVVYLMNNRHVVKLGADNPIETQIIEMFARSEFFKNCEPVLEQQRQEGAKAGKTYGSKLLSAFRSLSPSSRLPAPASTTSLPQAPATPATGRSRRLGMPATSLQTAT